MKRRSELERLAWSVAYVWFELRDGQLFWKMDKAPNARKGDLAGWLSANGRWIIAIDDRFYYRSNIVWLLTYGEWPEGFEVDHWNRRRDDDRPENLRPATRSQQEQNKELNSRNTSGVKGVYWDTGNQKWRVQITIQGRKISLGSFDYFEDAVEARREGERKFFDIRYYHDGTNG
jgi:hypothetical protein